MKFCDSENQVNFWHWSGDFVMNKPCAVLLFSPVSCCVFRQKQTNLYWGHFSWGLTVSGLRNPQLAISFRKRPCVCRDAQRRENNKSLEWNLSSTVAGFATCVWKPQACLHPNTDCSRAKITRLMSADVLDYAGVLQRYSRSSSLKRFILLSVSFIVFRGVRLNGDRVSMKPPTWTIRDKVAPQTWFRALQHSQCLLQLLTVSRRAEASQRVFILT